MTGQKISAESFHCSVFISENVLLYLSRDTIYEIQTNKQTNQMNTNLKSFKLRFCFTISQNHRK